MAINDVEYDSYTIVTVTKDDDADDEDDDADGDDDDDDDDDDDGDCSEDDDANNSVRLTHVCHSNLSVCLFVCVWLFPYVT